MKKSIIFLSFILISTAVLSQVDRSIVPKPGPPPEINLQQPQTFELLNGLKVLVVENNKLPRVSMRLYLDTPPILEAEKAGVSSLTGLLLGNGSQSISKDEFNEEVDFLGASISFGPLSASARSLSKYFPRIVELMADAAINPNFIQEDLDTEKERLITSLKNDDKDVGAIAVRVQNALTYGTSHPYGEFSTIESVERVSLDDIKKFYADYFVPANAYLAVVGDVKFDEVKELVTTHFTPWIKASPLTYDFTDPQDVQYTQINFVDMPNAVQSEIRAVNLVDLKMKDPDFLAAILANRIYGGWAQGRLQQNIREDKGYTYDAQSRLGNDKYARATLRAQTSVRNAVTDSAVVEILHELDSITTAPINEQELKDIKASYIGNFVMSLENPATIARFALNIITEDLPEDFYTTYLERINNITAEDVQTAAKKHFKAANTRIIVVGKGSEVIKNLEKIRFRGKQVPVFYFDKMGTSTEKPDYSVSLPEGVDLNSVIDSYLNAIGGKEKISEIRSLKLVYEGTAMGTKVKTEEKRTTDKYAQTTYMNDNPMMGVIAKGGEFYMKQGANKVPLPPEMQSDLAYAIGILPELGIVNNAKAKLTGIESIEGRDAYKVEVPGEVVQGFFFYDVETGLKLKEISIITTNGQTQNQEVSLKDYQEFEGVKFPTTKVGRLGTEVLESKLLEASINASLTESDFE